MSLLNIVRWSLFIPGAVIGCLASAALFRFVYDFAHHFYRDELPYLPSFEETVVAAAQGSAFVWTGVLIVPGAKTKAAVLLSAMVAIFSGTGLVYACLAREWLVVWCAAVMIAAGFGMAWRVLRGEGHAEPGARANAE